MKKEEKYTYDKLLYFFDVKLTGVFCIFIIFATMYIGTKGYLNRNLLLFIDLIAFYTIWNSFISKSNTEVVAFTDTYLSFNSLGREDKYELNTIKQIRIREFPSAGRMYIRINDYGMLKGRYWIQFKKFEHGNELFRKLIDIEFKLNPDSLKSRARKVNTKYIELEKREHQKD